MHLSRSALLSAALLAACMPHRLSPAPAAPGRFLTEEIDAGALGARRYRLYLPGGTGGRGARPLVVMLHGCTQDPDDFARGTRMNALAEQEGVLVAYPEQPATANPTRCWNWYEPANQRRGSGEPALVAAVTRQVTARHQVDPARVYVAGVSAGGVMALATALAYPELYAAVGVHSGVALGAAHDVASALATMRRGAAVSHPALAAAAREALGGAPAPAAIVFHGAGDAVVAPANGEQVVAQLLAIQAPRPADAAVEEEVTRPGEGRHAYRRGVYWRDSSRVEAWTVDELGHAWSGGSPEGTFTDARGPDASREMLRFFLAHPRPTAAAAASPITNRARP